MVIFACFYGPMYSMLGTYKEGNGGSDIDNLGCRDGGIMSLMGVL